MPLVQLNENSISTFFLKYITFMRLLLGCYRVDNESKLHRFCLKLYCFCISSVFITLYVYYISHAYISFNYNFYYTLFFDYALTVIIRLFYAENQFSQYCRAIQISDRIAGVKKVPLIGKGMSLVILITTMLRAIIITSRIFCVQTIHGYPVMVIMLLFSDLSQLITTIIFSILQRRMKLLRKYIETSSVLIHVTGRNSVGANIRNTRKCLHYYNNLLDNLEYVNIQVQCSVNIIFLHFFWCDR